MCSSGTIIVGRYISLIHRTYIGSFENTGYFRYFQYIRFIEVFIFFKCDTLRLCFDLSLVCSLARTNAETAVQLGTAAGKIAIATRIENLMIARTVKRSKRIAQLWQRLREACFVFN